MNPLTFRIRQAVPSDLPLLERIEESCFPVERRSSRRGLQRSLYSPNQSVWIAVGTMPRKPAGAMVLHHHPASLRIYSLAVLPDFRHAGIGRRLVRTAIDRAVRGGKQAISLEADARNATLIDWYTGQGFAPVALLPDYYAPGAPALRMRKALLPRPQRKVLHGRT